MRATPRAQRSHRALALGVLVLTVMICATWLCMLRWPRIEHEPPALREADDGPVLARAARPPALPVVPVRASISGTVSERDNRAIAGATVCASCVFPSCGRAGKPETFCTTSARDGGYALRELAPASYHVIASAPGYAPGLTHSHSAVDGAVTFEGTALTAIDIVLARGGARLAGSVLDAAGGPIAAATIAALTMPSEPERAVMTLARSGEDGRFELFTADESQVMLRASAPGYASAQRLVLAPAEDVALELVPGSRLRGRVVSALDGHGVAGVEVRATKVFSHVLVDGDGSATSTADGSFAIENLSEGTFRVNARAPRWSSNHPATIELGAAGSIDGVRIEVVQAVTVEGRVLAPGDRPCPSGMAGLSGTADGARTPLEIVGAIAEDGRVRFDGVPSGEYEAKVACAESLPRSDYPHVRVGQSDIRDLVFRTENGAVLRGRVVDGAGRGLARELQIKSIDADADPTAIEAAPSNVVQSAADGRFEIANLRPGRYRVSGGVAGEVTRDVELTARKPTSVELVITHSASLRVRVTAAAGRAGNGDVLVVAASGGDPWIPSLQTDGSFLLNDLAPGDYVVAASDGRNPPVQVTRNLQTGAEALVELSLPSYGGSLRGRVLDTSGAPVDDAWVSASAHRDGPIGFGVGHGVLTGPDGSFEIASLAPQTTFTVEARRTGGDYAVTPAARPGQDLTLVVQATAPTQQPAL